MAEASLEVGESSTPDSRRPVTVTPTDASVTVIPGRFIGIVRYVPGPDKPDLSRIEWCVICQKIPLMLRNR